MTRSPFVKLNAFLLLGVLFAIGALLSHFYVPLLIQNAIVQKFILQPDSPSYENWQKSGVPIYSQYYLFNVTNSDQLFNKSVRPVVQEVGPYTFKQVFEKVNITWNNENGTVSYQQVKRWTFVPSMNNLSLEDEIIHINVPLISAIHQIETGPKQDQYVAYESLNSLIDTFKLKIFMRTKVKNLLFEGYDDDLLETASTFYPSKVPYTKFGWLYARNNTASDGVFRIFTGQYDFGKKLGFIDTWNNKKYISNYKSGYNCQTFNHTSTGDLQPPFFLNFKNYNLLNYLNQNDEQEKSKYVRMFIADMCRSFDLEYKETVQFKGIEGYRYQAAPSTFNYTLEENRCYCPNNVCPPNGLFNLGDCSQGSPIFLSHPHYLYASQTLQQSVLGLKPSVEKHEFLMDYEKKFGITMNVNARFQINLLVKKNPIVEILADWPDDLEIYLPQFWFATKANINDTIANKIILLSTYLPLIIFITTIILAITSVIFFAFVVIYAFVNHVFVNLNQIPKYESVTMLETKVTSSNFDRR